jgi:hypothetical protein
MVFGHRVVHIAEGALVHVGYIVVVADLPTGLAVAVDKVADVMVADHRVEVWVVDHIGKVAVPDEETEDMETTFGQVVVEQACCSLIGLEGRVMMLRTDFDLVVEGREIEVVLVSQDVEADELLAVGWGLADMDWQAGRDRADRRCSLRPTSCSREAYVAVGCGYGRRRGCVGCVVQAAGRFIGGQGQSGDRKNGSGCLAVGGGYSRMMTSVEQARASRGQKGLCLPREHRHLGLRLDMADTVVAQDSQPVRLVEGIRRQHLLRPSLTRDPCLESWW